MGPPLLLLLLLVIGTGSKPSGVTRGAFDAFVSDGQMTERELLLLKGRLRRLAVSHSRALAINTKSPDEERAAIAFSQDHSAEEVGQNRDTEEGINSRAGLSDYLYQGDILMTPEQALHQLQTKKKRAALPPSDAPVAKWNRNRLGYFFDTSVAWVYREKIEQVLDYYRKRTCVKFTRSWPSKVEIVLKFKMASGCWSYVGRLPRYQASYGYQDIGFEPACFNQFGTIAHEVMHALGFQHEHIRKDRDGYIAVNYQNIWKNDTYNYDKDLKGDFQNFTYELGSIMHYGDQGDVFNLQDAKIYTKDYKQIMTIGNRMFPTFQDIAQINTYYGCYDRCKNSTTECKNGGLPDVNNCSSCECPHGFGGQFCTEVEPSTVNSTTCGGILDAKVGETQTFSGSVKCEEYQKFMVEKCYWHIRAPPGKKVKVFVTGINMSCTAGCPWSALEVKEGNFQMAGTRKCCTAGTSYDYYTSVDNLLVIGMFSKNGEANATWTYRAE